METGRPHWTGSLSLAQSLAGQHKPRPINGRRSVKWGPEPHHVGQPVSLPQRG